MENTFFFEKYDTVKMQTFDFGCPHILAQQHHLVMGSRHKNFEDQMLLSLDMKKQQFLKVCILMCHALP
jgi:hypothetical protein